MTKSKSSDEELLISTTLETSSSSSFSPAKKQGFLCGDLFPTFGTFAIFVAYVSLFVNQGILVTATKKGDKTYDYSIVAVVLTTELCKLVASAVIFLVQQKDFGQLITEIGANYKLCLWYFVPAGLYCLYNNLSFLNLAWYDPTTYFILLQIRVLLTGATFQVVFQKRLTPMQWFSLVVLTSGCIIKQISFSSDNKTDNASSEAKYVDQSSLLDFLWRSFFNTHFILMVVQVLCSCIAGVYNEYLLKEKGNHVHVMVQNIFMYFDSCVCNILVLLFFGQGGNVSQADSSISSAFASIMKPMVLLIIVNNCTVGIVTSIFLKHLNSIVKVFASAFELTFSALLSWILFGIPINWPTAFAIVIVSIAMYLYTVNPVINLSQVGKISV